MFDGDSRLNLSLIVQQVTNRQTQLSRLRGCSFFFNSLKLNFVWDTEKSFSLTLSSKEYDIILPVHSPNNVQFVHLNKQNNHKTEPANNL